MGIRPAMGDSRLENFINLEIVQKVDNFLKNLIVPIYREGYLLEKR
jgi:hypothetical protein